MEKLYCVNVLGTLGFGFTEKEYNEHETIVVDGERHKVCFGKNSTLILVPVSSFDVCNEDEMENDEVMEQIDE